MDHENTQIEERTGQSRHVRQVLRAAREAAGLTQGQVAERITQRLQLERPLTSSAVSEWERFGRHPAINVMAAWARVLGRRLIVQLDDSDGDRVAVLLHRDVVELARAIDMLSSEDRALVEHVISRMKPVNSRV